jgi:hypothetical protein
MPDPLPLSYFAEERVRFDGFCWLPDDQVAAQQKAIERNMKVVLLTGDEITLRESKAFPQEGFIFCQRRYL